MRNLAIIATVATLSLGGAAFAQSTNGPMNANGTPSSEGRAAAPDSGPAGTGGALNGDTGTNASPNSGAGHLGASGNMNGNANGNHMSGSNGQ